MSNSVLSFKEFLAELDDTADTENLSAGDLKQRAQSLLKQAQMKSAGQDQQVQQIELRNLQTRLRTATDPRQKADLQRRIQALTMKRQQQGQQQPGM